VRVRVWVCVSTQRETHTVLEVGMAVFVGVYGCVCMHAPAAINRYVCVCLCTLVHVFDSTTCTSKDLHEHAQINTY